MVEAEVVAYHLEVQEDLEVVQVEETLVQDQEVLLLVVKEMLEEQNQLVVHHQRQVVEELHK
tara:strand:+ start:143 stop:328 length:186 start_codon:yes stop_codon:yes gene_type:complete